MTSTGASVDVPRGGAGLVLSVGGSRRRPHVVVAGSLDASTAEQFRTRIGTLVDAGARSVVIDLGQVEITDSGGAAALMGAFGEVQRHGGEMVLKSARSSTLRVLHQAGLDDAIPLY